MMQVNPGSLDSRTMPVVQRGAVAAQQASSMCQERQSSAGMEGSPKHAAGALKTIKPNESRKVRKPLMEKRRRARINDCLDELKRLLLDAELKHPGSRPAKLEKADILELTVRHVRRLTRHERQADTCRYRAGFSECAREVRSELGKLEEDSELRERLCVHLDKCLASLPAEVPKDENSSEEEVTSSSSSSISPPPPDQRVTRSLTLVPTKLPNGDLAFVIPAMLRTDRRESEHQSTQQEPVWRPW